MSSYLLSPEELLNIAFNYGHVPNDQPFIRLLILLPGVAWDGGGDPLKCLLTTHNWDPETGFIHHVGANGIEGSLVSQETLNGELYTQPVQQQIKNLTHQCDNDAPCTCLTYEALSYEWGMDERRYRISLNGQTFGVTRNLQQALYHLRHASAIRRLWVDAICINQKSDGDKGKQIGQMDRVYTSADHVLAWLGLAVKNGHLAFDFAEKLYATACLTPDLNRGTDGELYINQSQWLGNERYLSISSHLLHSSYANEWLALHWVFKRSYWARAWVFQEIILAKRLSFVCGKRSMTWGVMEIAMQVVKVTADETVDLINSSIPIADQNTLSPVTKDDPHHFHADYCQRLMGILEGKRYRKNIYTMESPAVPAHATELLLEMIHIRLCKLQHDLIYSILGLVPPSVASNMPVPNYDEPVTGVFKQFAKAFVVGTKNLNILCYSHHSDTQDDLPSWVLDWRREERLAHVHNFANYIGTRAHREWHALAFSKHIPTFSDDGTTITIYGVSYDVVTPTQLELGHKLLPNIQKLTKEIKERDAFGVSRCHHDTHKREWWLFKEDARALLGDAPPDSPLLYNDQASTLLHILSSTQDAGRSSASTNQKQTRWKKPNNFEDVYDAMSSVTKCRTAFKTDKGDIGLGPMWMQSDDILCQFFGCTAASILRKVDNQQYRFVGDCYTLEKMGRNAIWVLETAVKCKVIRAFTLV